MWKCLSCIKNMSRFRQRRDCGKVLPIGQVHMDLWFGTMTCNYWHLPGARVLHKLSAQSPGLLEAADAGWVFHLSDQASSAELGQSSPAMQQRAGLRCHYSLLIITGPSTNNLWNLLSYLVPFPSHMFFLTWLYRQKTPSGTGWLLLYEMLCRTSAETCRFA